MRPDAEATMLEPMELDWLETFLAVADRRGFTAASEQVHRSQSRVSAHIAALERDLGVRLIDRAHRPATLTAAGEVFARHARDIVGGVDSARSAVAALRGLDQGSLALLTTPCIGATLFVGVLTELTVRFPGLRIALSEQSWHDVERRFLGGGVSMAVLPALAPPLTRGVHQHRLWCEPLHVVVRPDHELAVAGEPVPLNRLVRQPLVVSGASADAEPEVLQLLAARGLAVRPRVAVDNPQTLVGLARSGVGTGVLNAVALRALDTTGLSVLGIEPAELHRVVAAYWTEALLDTSIGRRLHEAVLTAPVPAGATPPSPSR